MASTQANELRVGVVQMTSGDDWDANLKCALAALDELESAGPLDLACFPENALFFKIEDGECYPAAPVDDVRLLPLRERARDSGFAIHIGSAPILEDGRVFTASVLIGYDGAISADYRKIHLFDSDVEGHSAVRESASFAHGQRPFVFEVKGWKFGSSICYDVRFAELYSFYARAQVDAILIPAAFLASTGEAHWEILARARAIESQAYVLAAAQSGEHRGQKGSVRRTWGQSIAIDPWGATIDSCAPGIQGTRTFRIELRREAIEKARKQIPMSTHRRL